MQERSLTLFTNCPPDTTSNGVFGAVRRIADRSRLSIFLSFGYIDPFEHTDLHQYPGSSARCLAQCVNARLSIGYSVRGSLVYNLSITGLF